MTKALCLQSGANLIALAAMNPGSRASELYWKQFCRMVKRKNDLIGSYPGQVAH